MARKKKTDEEPVVAPEVKEEEVVAPAAAPATELSDTLEAIEVEAERNPMPQIETNAAPLETSGLAGERPEPKAVTPEEVEAQRRAEGKTLMQDKLETAKANSEKTIAGEAIDQGTVAVANTPDFNKTQQRYIQDLENKSFVQWALDQKAADEARLAEEKAQIEQERKAARMTGFAELGSALANLFGVAEGNAVSQQHKQFSQDWMRKADADAREHRNRVADLRQRQRDTELKIAQLRQQGLRETLEQERKLRQDALAEQKAILDAKLKQGDLKLNEYKAETERLKTLSTAANNEARTDIQKSNAARGWAQTAAEQNKYTNSMIQKGWVPDSSAEGGFRYDPKEAKRRYGVIIEGADYSEPTPERKKGFAWNPQGEQSGMPERKPGWSLGGETPQEEKKEDKTPRGNNTDKSPSSHLFD